MNDSSPLETRAEEVQILTEVLNCFKKLDSDGRQRLLQTVATFFQVEIGAPPARTRMPGEMRSPPTFSENRAMPPKQFMLEKQPRTDVEKVACLGYYLTHYRDTPYFKTLDISKLNTEAAQIKFSNATVAVENATKQNYLVPATKGNKQLSSLGEQFVLALPDREKARAAMTAARPKRRSRRSQVAGESAGQD